MTIRLTALLPALFLAGCSSAVSNRPDPVDVTFTVTLPGGQPAQNVTVNFFPTSADQMQGGGKTDAAGKLKAKLMPGKHTFAVEGSSPSLKLVPRKYLANAAENNFEVPGGGGAVSLKLNN